MKNNERLKRTRKVDVTIMEKVSRLNVTRKVKVTRRKMQVIKRLKVN